MFLKRILPIVIVLIAGLFYFFQKNDFCIGKTNSTYQNGWQGSFEVKVERKPEKCGIVAGAYYIFSSRQGASGNWQDIMMFRHDDPIDIPKENLQIVNDKVAFVFMGWKAAITSDAGKTWNLFDAEKSSEFRNLVNYRLIEKVEILPNGTGKMILDPVSNEDKTIELYTSDFGKNWNRIN
jgi:hypothetical protein